MHDNSGIYSDNFDLSQDFDACCSQPRRAPNKTFTEYLDHLNNHGYLTPKNKNWVDHIRKKGNDANHTIDPIFQHEAETLITFLEMLLRLTYEFPGKMPAGKP